jgi:hypothetical protein
MNFYIMNGGMHIASGVKRNSASYREGMSLQQALDFAETVRQMAREGRGIIDPGIMEPVDKKLLAEHFADIEKEKANNRGEGRSLCPYCKADKVEAIGAKTCTSLECVDQHAKALLASGEWGNREPIPCPECGLWFQPKGKKHKRHSGPCATKHDNRTHQLRRGK